MNQMRRMCLLLWGAASLSLSIPVVQAKEDPPAPVRAALAANGIAAQSVQAAPLKGLYEVVTASHDLLYVSTDGKYIFAGEIIDAGTHERLTQERIDKLQRVDFTKDLPHDLTLKVGDAHAKRHILIVVDPNCPYCRDLENRLALRKDLSEEILVTGLLGPRSREDARTILCSSDPLAALDAKTKGNPLTPVACVAGDEKLARIDAWLQVHPVQVTPETFFPDGSMAKGDLSDVDLADRLAKAN
ncbi:putative thiol:disulfide interchange protein DsbC (plasmid) [Caballeronia sp. SBC1]|uniref:DsbC family protein n=1 Tax=Caballeronia sp. SBC1 TaxID=2705548 RepID=UPI00140CEC9B|nr:DsbC family protein [Caballeronia sp. SBC1]QIN67821.1 putative thiol:disulfide interchange protein DsbC [Caballeronia sp. SBC1]